MITKIQGLDKPKLHAKNVIENNFTLLYTNLLAKTLSIFYTIR
jgi:hypothetical protein